MSKYVSPLINRVFGIRTKYYFDDNTFNVKISSRAICRHLFREWGIPYGNKIEHGAKVPSAILQNRQLFVACLRGLIDTDGSVSKDGSTISIKFHSSNPPLLSSVLEGLKIHKLDFFSFAYERSCGTHSTGKVKEYFRTVGSSNLKHVLKFNEWHTHGRLICTKDTLALFGSYRNTPLPFYLERNTQ